MISIVRARCPDRLSGGSSARNRYALKEVVECLHAMQHGKCCYCEMRVSDEGHGRAVEHFAPKAVFAGRRNDWDNLLLACAQCNGKKSDDFPVMLTDEPDEAKALYLTEPAEGTPLLIDPSDTSIDPEEHLTFELDDRKETFGLIHARNNSQQGKLTIKVVGLDRAYYTREHRDHLLELAWDYLTLLVAKNGGHDGEVKRYEGKFRMHVAGKSKLAAVAREFARDKQLDRRFNVPIPSGAANE